MNNNKLSINNKEKTVNCLIITNINFKCPVNW